MQLYYIRHAQSENNLLWHRTGSSVGRSADPELTDVGWRQVQLLAQFLMVRGADPPQAVGEHDRQNVGGFRFTHLYTSLMVRAVATGTAISEAIGLPLVGWKIVHETGGIYERDAETGEPVGIAGNDRAFFEERYPDLVLPESLGEEGWWNRPFETREERPARARRFLEELLERHGTTDDRVALISHGGFYNHVLSELFRLPELRRVWFSLNNAAITRIDFHQEGREGVEPIRVAYMNRVDFLPAELIT